MKFNYTAIIASASDTGEPMVMFRPEITVRIHGSGDSRDFLALVDTGANNTILPESIARDLNIPLSPCKGPSATAFGGQEIKLSYADVELELLHNDGNLRWFPRVYFVLGDASQETIILGHQGFLDYFTAIFDGEDCTVNLQPNDYLPTHYDPENG